MKRSFFNAFILFAAAALLICAAFAGCGSSSGSIDLPEYINEGSLPEVGEGGLSGAEIAIVATDARLTTAFGQGVQSTVNRFAGEMGLNGGTYKAEEGDTTAAIATLELAITGGAKLVIAMDEVVSQAVNTAAAKYPEVDFILFDMPENLHKNKNAAIVRFSNIEAGWLAGYAAASENKSCAGLVYSSDAEAEEYALGFLYGAQAVMAESGAQEDMLEIVRLEWSEAESEQFAELLPVLLDEKAGAVFAAGAEIKEMVLAEAEKSRMPVIAPEINLEKGKSPAASISYDSKNITQSLLESWKNGEFPGGQTVTGGIEGGDIVFTLKEGVLKKVNENRMKQAAAVFVKTGEAQKLEAALENGMPSEEDAEEAFELLTIRLPQEEDETAGLLNSSASVSESSPESLPVSSSSNSK